MIGEVPGIVVAIVIGVIVIALAVGVARQSRATSGETLGNLGEAAGNALGVD